MNDERMTELLNQKIEWMGRLFREAENLDQYQWTKVDRVRHRCGGEIYVFVETTGIGYVCAKCEEAEVL
jgi:hypothetical protein